MCRKTFALRLRVLLALQTGAARFPVRQERDLSGYVPDGHHGGIPTQLVIPPGTSDEDRAAIEQAQVRELPRIAPVAATLL